MQSNKEKCSIFGFVNQVYMMLFQYDKTRTISDEEWQEHMVKNPHIPAELVRESGCRYLNLLQCLSKLFYKCNDIDWGLHQLINLLNIQGLTFKKEALQEDKKLNAQKESTEKGKRQSKELPKEAARDRQSKETTKKQQTHGKAKQDNKVAASPSKSRTESAKPASKETKKPTVVQPTKISPLLEETRRKRDREEEVKPKKSKKIRKLEDEDEDTSKALVPFNQYQAMLRANKQPELSKEELEQKLLSMECGTALQELYKNGFDSTFLASHLKDPEIVECLLEKRLEQDKMKLEEIREKRKKPTQQEKPAEKLVFPEIPLIQTESRDAAKPVEKPEVMDVDKQSAKEVPTKA